MDARRSDGAQAPGAPARRACGGGGEDATVSVTTLAAVAGVAGAAYAVRRLNKALGPSPAKLKAENRLLQANYAPVRDEVHAAARLGADRRATTAVPGSEGLGVDVVSGHVPADLRGAFVRVGPNPHPDRIPDAYHWFDGEAVRSLAPRVDVALTRAHGIPSRNALGDLQAHAMMFVGEGEAGGAGGPDAPPTRLSYSNHFIRTHKFETEEKLGSSVTPGIGHMYGLRPLWPLLKLWWLRRTGAFPDTPEGRVFAGNATTPSNTALVYHDRRLLALHEQAAPMVLRLLMDGHWESVGLHLYGGKLDFPCTAHPKVDPDTGDMHFFGYQGSPGKPFLQFAAVSADGVMTHKFDVGLERMSMMHDFAVSENYAVIIDAPLTINPKRFLEGKFVAVADPRGVTRFGVFDKNAARSKGDIRWFEVKPCFVVHTANAYEEGAEVVVVACRFSELVLESAMGAGPDMIPLSKWDHSDMSRFRAVLYEWRFNLSTGAVSERTLVGNTLAGEFPTINRNMLGRKTRYVYLATMSDDKGLAQFDGVAKCDMLEGRVVARRRYGDRRFGGEAVFVPKPGARAEDDGYLLSWVHDERDESRSEVWVMDARGEFREGDAGALTPLCVLRTPQRVPYGFHGLWVTEDELREQRDAADLQKLRPRSSL